MDERDGMPKTGPQKYPGASTAAWYQGQYPGDAMESNVVVWHSTEGTSLPGYGGGSQAPNFTAVPDFGAKKLRWYQHFDFDVSSRALMNRAGGVETNTLNAVQVEIVGTCDPTAHRRWSRVPHLYTPELPDWVIRDLAAFAAWAKQKHGVPLSSAVSFRPYPASYGSTLTRMSGAKWEDFKGHCGHQHVPENDHGDPGAFPMTKILNAALVLVNGSTTPEDDDMDALDVWGYRNEKENAASIAAGDGPIPDAYKHLRDTDHNVVQLRGQIAQQGTQITALLKMVQGISAKLDAL